MDHYLRALVLLWLAAWISTACASPGPRLLKGPTFVDGKDTYAAIEVGPDGVIRRLFRNAPTDYNGPIQQIPGVLAIRGLHDAHIHLSGIGQRAERADLRGASSIAEIRKRLQRFIAQHPDVSTILGRGWDQNRFQDKAFPKAADLDGLSGKPIVLTRVDGHALWVNRPALRLAEITEATDDPAGGKILRNDTGSPKGILIDRAMSLVRRKLPKPTDADITRWLIQGAKACVSAGLVAVHDMGMSLRKLRLLSRIAAAGELPPLRIFVYLNGSDERSYAELLQEGPRASIAPRVTLMGVKLFSDGALGSRGAALLAPYTDRPAEHGLLIMSEAELSARVSQAHDLGAQTAVHAIGDRGVRASLHAIEGAQGGNLGRRHRIEHAQIVHEADFRRFRELGVIASMQPTHATSDMPWAESRVGATRILGAYAWKRMLREGVRLAFGSDAPVEDHAPLWGLWAAVTRQDRSGLPAGGWYPHERLTTPEAIDAFTSGAAYAVMREKELGRLQPGFQLDLTVLDGDPMSKSQGWAGIQVTGTVVGGTWTSAASQAYHKAPTP